MTIARPLRSKATQMQAALGKHRHFFVVVPLLAIAMTWPAFQYIISDEPFFLPTGPSSDVYIKLWDAWYSGQVLTGRAERFYTNVIYYPEGVSLANHPLFLLHNAVLSALSAVMTVSQAFSLTHLLMIVSCAAAAYAYLHWLLNDKWVALFGAAVFGFCPQVVGQISWTEISWIAPMPLVAYFVHRGIREGRNWRIVIGGVIAGLTSEVSFYFFVCVIATLGLLAGALAASRWRGIAIWRQLALLTVAVTLACAWRVIPVLQDISALDAATEYYGLDERRNDLLSFVMNPGNPILGPIMTQVLDFPRGISLSKISYLGFLPIVLIAIGLVSGETRRRMLPWLGLGLVFVLLHLGSTLTIQGIAYEGVKLPKHYLDQLLPSVFKAFYRTNHFMAGICLPLAVLASYGLAALKSRYPGVARPRFIVGLILIVAVEFLIPVEMTMLDPISQKPFSAERLAWIDWLKREESGTNALIHVPFGRSNAKLYFYYQTLTGYPQTEGAISRPPDSAYNYIRGNAVLNAWYNRKPTNCAISNPAQYRQAVARLIEDGFTHVVHHRFYFWQTLLESWRYVEADFSNDFVSIYRLDDMLESCADPAPRG